MSAEHEFEKQVSRQLDALRISPHEDDWQRIYEQLHPRRRRRLLWWWLAGLLVLGGAGIYFSQQPAGNAQPHTAVKAQGPSAGAPIAGPVAANGAAPTAAQPSASSQPSRLGPALPEEQTKAETSGSSDQPLADASPQAPGVAAATAQGNARASAARRSPRPSLGPGATRSRPASTTVANEVPATDGSVGALPSVDGFSTTIADKPLKKMTGLATAEPEPMLIDPSLRTMVAPLYRQLPPAGQLLPPLPGTPAAPVLQKNRASQNSWRWGAYAGAGISQLRQSLTTNKAQADMALGNPGGSSAGLVRALEQTNQQAGHFWQAGLLAQYEWRQRARLQLGLGVAQHRWEATSTGRVDSFANTGAFVTNLSSYQVQTAQQLWLLELPLQYGRRLTANRPLSLWAEGAFVSAFQLSARQQLIRAEIQGANRAADTSSAVRLAASWLPQLRLGLSLQKRGRWHWQLSPAVAYSLNSGVQVGSLRRHLLSAQLQWCLLLPTSKAR